MHNHILGQRPTLGLESHQAELEERIQFVNSRLIRLLLSLAIWGVATLAFGVAYTQSILYEGNQNTKFLHGLAEDIGYLKADWLARTIDPLPAFTYLIKLTYPINQNLFYVYYILLMGVYLYSILGIVFYLFKIEKFSARLYIFAILLILHSRWFLVTTQNQRGLDLEFLHSGVAGQYLLGLEFQNSAFGVFLLLSILLFLRRKTVWAILAISVANVFHSAYLLSAGLVTLAFLLVLWWERIQELKQAQGFKPAALIRAAFQPFLLGLLALAFVIPVLAYNQIYLASTSPETWAESMSILVQYRIPHHSLPEVWLGKTAVIQFGIMLVGLALSWRSRLFPVILSLLAGGLALTVVQIVTRSDSLAALAPWRVSVLLVPVSTALIVAWTIQLVFKLQDRWLPQLELIFLPLALTGILVYTYGGIQLEQSYGSSFKNQKVVALMDFVIQQRSDGQVYLVPPREPDFDDFRIYTGVPLYINWKSHPYKDIELVEWYRRIQAASNFYDADPVAQCPLLEDLHAQAGVSHVIFKSKEASLACEFTREIYREQNFAIYSLVLP
jgi:hypothetical protein